VRQFGILTSLLLIACRQDAPTEQPDDTAEAAATPDPVLVVQSPAAAAWLPAGPTEVSGYVRDASDLRLNGDRLDVSTSDTFSVTADLPRGITVFSAEADGDDGAPLSARVGVIAGDFAEPGEDVTNGLLARLNQPGLATLADFGETLVTAEVLTEQLALANPVYNAEPIVGTQLQADLAGVDFEKPEIIVTPTDGALQLQVSIPSLVVDVDAFGEVAWIDFRETVQVTAERAVLTADVLLSVEDNAPAVQLVDPEVTLAGFAYDASILPSWIEDYLFTDSIRTAIEDALVDQMTEMVPAMLDETMAGLELAYSTEILGTALDVGVRFDAMDIDEDGLQLGLGLDMLIDGEAAPDKVYGGFLTAPEAPSVPDVTTPMALILGDDLLNHALFELWRGGLADVDLSTEDGSLDPTLFEGVSVSTATVSTRAALPPVIVETDGQLELQLAELELTVETPGGSIGERLVARVDVSAQVGFGIEDSVLGLELHDLELGLSVTESDWGLSEDGLKNILSGLLSAEALQETLDGLALELPELYGLSISEADVARGLSGYQTDVAVTVAVAE